MDQTDESQRPITFQLSTQDGETAERSETGSTMVRKTTRKDSILAKVRDVSGQGSLAYAKLRDHLINFSDNHDTLMDIFKSRSYKQNIKSKSRQSEALVI
jgi:hypothetical protein